MFARIPRPKNHWLIAIAALMLALLLSFQDAADRWVLVRTIGLGLGACLIAIPMGILIWWIARHRGVLSVSLAAVCFALVLLPMVVHVSSWDAAFGKLGWLSAVQGRVLTPLIPAALAAIWIHGIAAAPQVAILLMIASRFTSTSLEEQAQLETNLWQVFWRITLPRFRPLLVAAAIWIVLTCAREIAVTDLYQIGTLAEQVYLGYSLNNGSILGNWSAEQLTSADSLKSWLTGATILCCTLLSIAFFFRLMDADLETAQRRASSLPALTWNSQLTAILLLLILAGIPTANVLIRASFHVIPVSGVPTQAYSLQQLWGSIGRSWNDYSDEFAWSTLIAATSATTIVTISLIAGVIAWRSTAMRFAMAIVLAVCLALPGPVIGSLLARGFALMDWNWINWLTDYTIFGPVIANLIFCWPIGGILIWYLLKRTPSEQLENARLENVSLWQLGWQFGALANRLALAGIWLLLFAFCFGELSASQMVRPAGIDTVPRKMLGDLHAGVNELTAGITIIIAGGCVMVSLAGWALIWLNLKPRQQEYHGVELPN